MHEEDLVELGELALDEARADGVNDPDLHVLARDLQGVRDMRVGDGAGARGSGQAGEGQEADLARQLGVREGGGRRDEVLAVLVFEVVVVVQRLRGEDFQEFEEDWVGFAEGLDGVEGGEVLEVEMGGVGEGGFEGAEAERTGVGGGGFVGGNGTESTEEIEV